MKLFELTRKLIEIEAPSGEETPVMDFLSRYLDGLGFTVRKQTVTGDRYNILAHAGDDAGGGPGVVFSTHGDTVRPYVSYSEDDRYIHGRGACDTRGIMAAQLKAAEALKDHGVRGFGLLFVVGEEAGSDGAMAANTLPNQCRWLINGEPTENKMAVGTKGMMRYKLTTTGRACHSGYPELGESAIDAMLDILNDIRRIRWPVDDTLGGGNCNIGIINGGVQANVLAPHAEAHLMLRVVTTMAESETLLTDAVDGRGQLEFDCGYDPVYTHVLDGYETMVAGYGTDISFLDRWGKPVLFGPGSIIDAHTPGEKISKKQLQEAVGHYTDLMLRLLKQ